MNILLTNDDGIESEGLHILADALRTFHDVWITAPEHERSAASHAISLKKEVEITSLNERTSTCSGTPADCILFSLAGILPIIPDVVISGINRGLNIGIDTIYSGTVAAARQAALSGIPAVAVSAAGQAPPFPFNQAAEFIVRNLEMLIRSWNDHTVISVNVPQQGNGAWAAASLSKLGYSNRVRKVSQNGKAASYELFGEPASSGEVLPDSDWTVLQAGFIAVTPIHAYPLCNEESMRTLHTG